MAAEARIIMQQTSETRARRRRVTHQLRRLPRRRGFDEPFEDDERELMIGGGDDKPAAE